jgi:hypothetical protein
MIEIRLPGARTFEYDCKVNRHEGRKLYQVRRKVERSDVMQELIRPTSVELAEAG